MGVVGVKREDVSSFDCHSAHTWVLLWCVCVCVYVCVCVGGGVRQSLLWGRAGTPGLHRVPRAARAPRRSGQSGMCGSSV